MTLRGLGFEVSGVGQLPEIIILGLKITKIHTFDRDLAPSVDQHLPPRRNKRDRTLV